MSIFFNPIAPVALRNGLRTIVVAVALVFGVMHHPLVAQQPQSIAPSPVFLSIETRTGVQRFVVEIADEQKEREVGLMFREDLPQDQGMLFDFGTDRMVSMWMRNTPLSLDMVFINLSGTVVRVAENTTPFSPAIISSGEPVRYVLELNAGVASGNGIHSGDKVMHPLVTKNLSSN